MKIGNLELENNIFLAPMAGVTDLAFRLICKKWGAGLVFSEMVSAKALHYNDRKTLELLATDPAEAPLAVQIFGREPEIMAEAAGKLEQMGVKLLDINFGCPALKRRTVANEACDKGRIVVIGKIVKAVSGEVKIPVMCKIRAGYDEFADVCEIAKIIEDNGASAITVHPRTRKMFYSGIADRSKIADVKKAVSIPVIGNGDITDAESACDMFSKTNCDAVMVGRGSQGNPFIFTRINEYMEYGFCKTHISHKEKLQYMKDHLELLIKLKGEYVGVREARKHVAWYTKGMHGGATLRTEIFKTETAEKLISVIEEYKDFISEREDAK